MAEKGRHHHEGDRITEREAVIAVVPAKDVLGFDADSRAVLHDMPLPGRHCTDVYTMGSQRGKDLPCHTPGAG